MGMDNPYEMQVITTADVAGLLRGRDAYPLRSVIGSLRTQEDDS